MDRFDKVLLQAVTSASNLDYCNIGSQQNSDVVMGQLFRYFQLFGMTLEYFSGSCENIFDKWQYLKFLVLLYLTNKTNPA